MTKSENADFQEMFGATTPAESLNVSSLSHHPPAALPMDDPLYKFERVAQQDAAHEDAAFADELIGSREDEAMKGRIPIRPALPVSTSPALSIFVKRAARVLAQLPRHQRAIREITDRLRNSELFAPIKNDPAWDDLVRNVAVFVTGSILEAA